MNPYNAHSICIKCGHHDAGTIYHDDVRQCTCIVDGEHLERCCNRCFYAWPEACVDPRLADCQWDRHVYGPSQWIDGDQAYTAACTVPGCHAELALPPILAEAMMRHTVTRRLVSGGLALSCPCGWSERARSTGAALPLIARHESLGVIRQPEPAPEPAPEPDRDAEALQQAISSGLQPALWVTT